MNGEVVSKAEFSRQRGVSRARVTQWITEGKISGNALVGDGPSAKINVGLATAQLRERLQVDGRFGLNGLSTRLDDAAPPALRDDRPQPLAISRTVEARIKAEKLRHAQLMTSRLEEEDRLRRGVYMETSAARAEMGRVAADLLTSFEGALPDFASALAARFAISSRDALHCLRVEFRRIRERLAAASAASAAKVPPTLAVPEDEPGKLQ